MKKKKLLKYLLNASNRHEAVLHDLDIRIKSNLDTLIEMIISEARARMEMQEKIAKWKHSVADPSPIKAIAEKWIRHKSRWDHKNDGSIEYTLFEVDMVLIAEGIAHEIIKLLEA